MIFTKAQKQSVRSLHGRNRSQWRGMAGTPKDEDGNVLMLPKMPSDIGKKR